MKGETKTGFKFEVDTELLDDAEFLEMWKDAQEDGLKAFDVIEVLLGKEQKKRLYDHVRNDKGRVPVDLVTDELGDIIEAMARDTETKN